MSKADAAKKHVALIRRGNKVHFVLALYTEFVFPEIIWCTVIKFLELVNEVAGGRKCEKSSDFGTGCCTVRQHITG